MRTDDSRSSVLFYCLDLSSYFIRWDLSVEAEAGKVPDVGEVDIDILFGILDVLAFLTNRLTVNELIGKTVIIHDRPDDFTTQPSGNAGNKIACGVISKVRR